MSGSKGLGPSSAPLPAGAIEAVLDTDHVTRATRAAVRARLAWRAPATPLCFDARTFAVLRATCDRLVPQADPVRRVDLAARLDAALAEGRGDGWRYDVLPPDREAIRQALEAIDQAALASAGAPFVALAAVEQDRVLQAVQQGAVPQAESRGAPLGRLFEELLAQVVAIYVAHPFAQERMGYIGMADADGFAALGLDWRDPIEDEASVASL